MGGLDFIFNFSIIYLFISKRQYKFYVFSVPFLIPSFLLSSSRVTESIDSRKNITRYLVEVLLSLINH